MTTITTPTGTLEVPEQFAPGADFETALHTVAALLTHLSASEGTEDVGAFHSVPRSGRYSGGFQDLRTWLRETAEVLEEFVGEEEVSGWQV